MATNLSRLNTINMKRQHKVMYAEIAYTDIPTSAEVYQLLKLPKEVIVTKVTTIMIEAFVAGTSAVLDVGVNSGETLQANTDLEAAAGTSVISRPNIRYPTGGNIVITPVYVGAITAGKVAVIVEYLEYTMNNGELTSYIA